MTLASDEESAILAALASYGIDRAALTNLERLSGGLLSRVFRLDAGDDAFALKVYPEDKLGDSSLQLVCDAQVLARSLGIPVPAIVASRSGGLYTEAGGQLFVLSEFVPGRVYRPDAMPARAARRMGKMLGRLQQALATLPAGVAPALWSHEKIEAYLSSLLRSAEARRQFDTVDERAYVLLRQKLALLERLGEPPAYDPGWSHGDYHWRNVLFDDADEVAAVIDFDTVDYFSPARDLMRCVALSFPALGPETDAFFAGYARVRGLTPEEARGHVDLYRYLTSYRVWPLSARYLEPETYDPRWDEFIQPMPAWDWEELSDRLEAVAAGVSGSAAGKPHGA